MQRARNTWWIALVLFALPLAAQTDEPETESATFSMYCYWTGEATLGRVDGVLASRIGHWGGAEIVQVDYDPAKTDVGELAKALKRQRSFYSVIAGDPTERDAAARHVRLAG